MESDAVAVVAAILWKNDRLLICRRALSGAFPGKWEFPGGKVEAGEEPRAALARELDEELGIRACIGGEVAAIRHQYPGSKPVLLTFFEVREFDGALVNRVFAELRWAAPRELAGYDFLEADLLVIAQIRKQQIAQEQVAKERNAQKRIANGRIANESGGDR